MKYLLCLPAICCLYLCNAQEKISYLSEDGKPTKEKEAAILLQQLKINDTLWEFNFYDIYGPRSVSMQFLDESGTMLNGRYITYLQSGEFDTVGYYSHGVREGKWQVHATGYQQLSYVHGELAEKKEISHRDRDTTSGSATIVEIESEYPGGSYVWLRYLGQHLHYPKRAEKKEIQGKVVVDFLVDIDGHIDVSKIYLSRSREYSLDQEAIKMIRESHLWTPAVQNGKQVKSYKSQPLIFKLGGVDPASAQQ